MKAIDFDHAFEDGDISDQIDWAKARRPNLTIRRVNVDFPAWVIDGLDQQAQRLGITRQALIKVWIADRLSDHTPMRP